MQRRSPPADLVAALENDELARAIASMSGHDGYFVIHRTGCGVEEDPDDEESCDCVPFALRLGSRA